MSTRIPQGSERLTADALTRVFERGVKPRAAWRVGTEYEKFLIDPTTKLPMPYAGRGGVQELLEFLAEHFGWERYVEDGHLLALTKGSESVSIEPGGQIELSGAPLMTLHETAAELRRHEDELDSFASHAGVAYLWAGVHPTAALEHVEWMPKPRYAIMRNYLPTRGALGTSMMKLTCTVQCNVDYSSEEDAFRKLRLGMALTPVVTALFANSSRTEGRDTGYRSWRQHIWTAVDPDRCGQLPFAFEEGRSVFRGYADWALQAPMFFIHRDGRYVDLAGMRFADFLEHGAAGFFATMSDWELHLSTLFPDVRLKHYLEVRAADCVPPPLAMAVPALWKGVLYDDQAMDAAWSLFASMSFDERVAFRDEAARLGLGAQLHGRLLSDIARDLVDIAAAGLDRQTGVLAGRDERRYLEPLVEMLDGGFDSAERYLVATGKAGA